MNNLYILTKQEFTSIYRFGKIPLILNKVVKILGKSISEIDDLIFKEFQLLPFFIGDEEYLIITFENELHENIWLEIENVSEVIPLTKAAKNSIEMKFDARLKFKDARFEKVIRKVEEYIDLQERKSGAKAFWNLCKVKNIFTPLVSDKIITEAYYNKIEGRKSSEFNSDFLVHLLSYDRYEFFPNSDLGYFYDVGEIFAHSKGKRSFFGSSFHTFLEKNKQHFSQLGLLQITQIISSSDEIINFTKQLTTNNLKVYISSVLYLKFKDDLAERETIKDSETGKIIGDVRRENILISELNLAIYLAGSFFGYQKFYDDLYELVDLKIFKEKLRPVVNNVKNTSEPNLHSDSQEINETDNDAKSTAKSFESDDISVGNIILEENVDVEFTELTVEKLELEVESLPSFMDSQVNEKTKEEVAIINEIPVINEPESDLKLVNSSKEYNKSEKLLLDLILTILDQEKGVFELKTERLSELKKVISASIHEKNNLNKDDIIQFIKQTFESSIKVETKGNKCFISKNSGGSLFNNL